MRRILLIAYHFPPLLGSSGIQRTLRFVQYLPSFGWEPTVLTVHPRAYPETDAESLKEIPVNCDVVRVPCVDAARHLSVLGFYPQQLTVPDRWASWSLLGPRVAGRICRKRGIDVIWSTYPMATAHKIAAEVKRRTGLPWVADIRDPMIDEGFPSMPLQRRAFERIEADVMEEADRVVFVTPSARAKYAKKYPDAPSERLELVENGFDESTFTSVSGAPPSIQGRPLVLLHSGIVYPLERDPTALFRALSMLKEAKEIRKGDFVLRFRAPVVVDLLRALAAEHRVEDWIEIGDQVNYRAALQEMLESDALVILQGRICNEQIPAKMYEYLRAGRPVLGLTDPEGDTGRRLASLGVPHVAALEDADAIAHALLALLRSLQCGTAAPVPTEVVSQYSRRHLTGSLAGILDAVVDGRGNQMTPTRALQQPSGWPRPDAASQQ